MKKLFIAAILCVATVSLGHGQDVKDITSGAKERAAGIAKEQTRESFDDASITAEIKIQFSKAPRLKGQKIEVSTTGGVVTLEGKVDGMRAKKDAGRIARSIKGVKSVDNKLDVGFLVK